MHPQLTGHTRHVISVKNVIIGKNVIIWGKYHDREKWRKIRRQFGIQSKQSRTSGKTHEVGSGA